MVNNPLQYQYVDPELMVGDHYIPLISTPFVHSDHLKMRPDDAFLEQVVETYPAAGAAIQLLNPLVLHESSPFSICG